MTAKRKQYQVRCPDGLTYREVAERVGMTIMGVRKIEQRALVKLYWALKMKGIFER